MENPTTISRDPISKWYRKHMVTFLRLTRGLSEEKAIQITEEDIKKKVKPPTFDVIRTLRPGSIERQSLPFSEVFTIMKSAVVLPSGSFFIPPYIMEAITTKFITVLKATRSKYKKKKFEYYQLKEFLLSVIYDSLQNAAKILLNSLPGAKGFPGVIFYDKGAYNSITSGGRVMILNAVVGCEQLLAGNLPLFNEEELINHLICIINKIDDTSIIPTLKKHNLEIVSLDKVKTYLERGVAKYDSNFTISTDSIVDKVLKGMSQGHLQFVWYHSNLFNFWIDSNGDRFHKELHALLDISTLTRTTQASESDWKAVPRGIRDIVTVVMAKESGKIHMEDLKDHPRELSNLVELAHRLLNYLNGYKDVWHLFFQHPMRYQLITTRNSMHRKAVGVSDTDSEMPTVALWSDWFTGIPGVITEESYNISAFIAYLMIDHNVEVLRKFAIDIGVTGSDIDIIEMKNEFMYPVMLLFDIKKVYAALCAIQEGVFKHELEADIKGAPIRGAKAALPAREFTKNFIVESVLKPAIKGQLDAAAIIKTVVTYEYSIYRSLHRGELTFIPNESLRPESHYKTPISSAHFYRMSWDEIFSSKYGNIPGAGKWRKVKVEKNAVHAKYLEWLDKKDPTLGANFRRFILQHKKMPTAFFLPPTIKEIPKELRPIVAYRDIIYVNAKPVHLVLDAINVSVGHDSKRLLLSEIYGNLSV